MNAIIGSLDPFALGGREDEAILSLFRKWIDGQRAAQLIVDESEAGDEVTAANDRLDDLTREIDKIPVQGMSGLAVKSYLAIHSEFHAWELGHDSAGLHRLDPKTMGVYHAHSIIALLGDAARFVPEIAPLLPPPSDDTEPQAEEAKLLALRERVAAIVAEFDLPLPDGDAGIFEAARRKRDLDARFRALHHEFRINMAEEEEINPERDRLEGTLLDHLEKHAKPQTLAAAATLLRHGFENGMQIDPDDGMVGNVLALIERESAAKGGAV